MPADDYAVAGLSGEQVMDYAAKASVWPYQARDLLTAAAPLIAARVRQESDAERDAELAAIADQVERSGPSSAWEAAKLVRRHVAHPTALDEHDQRNAARVRAQVAEEIAQAIEAMHTRHPLLDQKTAADIARAHATTEEDERAAWERTATTDQLCEEYGEEDSS